VAGRSGVGVRARAARVSFRNGRAVVGGLRDDGLGGDDEVGTCLSDLCRLADGDGDRTRGDCIRVVLEKGEDKTKERISVFVSVNGIAGERKG
jgi:hypothetical protein